MDSRSLAKVIAFVNVDERDNIVSSYVPSTVSQAPENQGRHQDTVTGAHSQDLWLCLQPEPPFAAFAAFEQCPAGPSLPPVAPPTLDPGIVDLTPRKTRRMVRSHRKHI